MRRSGRPRPTSGLGLGLGAVTAVAAAAVTAAGCGDSPAVFPPYTAEVLSYSSEGRYQLADEPLTTLTSVDPFRGGAGWIRGGGAISVNGDVGGSDDQIRDALTPKDVHGLRLQYEVDGGVIRSIDYDTFAVLTIYRELERAQAFYAGIGVPMSALAPLPVYFRGRIEVFFIPLLATNNAAYVPAIDSFLFFNDFFNGNEVPLALNLGVIGHEYGHAVFQHQVWGTRLPPALQETWPTATINHLRSLDEGLADVMGATLTDDPNFVGRSLAEIAAERDLSMRRTASSFMFSEAEGGDLSGYDPYPLGSVIASALWAAGTTIGRAEVAGYVVLAEQDIAGRVNNGFRIVQFLDALARVSAAVPAHRQAFCASFSSRLAAAGTAACCVSEASCGR